MTAIPEWVVTTLGTVPPREFWDWWCDHTTNPADREAWRIAIMWAYNGYLFGLRAREHTEPPIGAGL